MDKCPMCGYVEVRANKPHSNIMSHYRNKANAKDVCVFNSGDAVITIGEGKDAIVYEKYDPSAKVVAPVAAPVASAKPSIPAVTSTPSTPQASIVPTQP